MSARHDLAPARSPERRHAPKLLELAAGQEPGDRLLAELPSLLGPADLVVVNDAATLPASLPLDGADAELRLAAFAPGGGFVGVLFGAGSSRIPTEERGPAPRVAPGDGLTAGGLGIEVVAVDADEPRLVTVRFDRTGAELWSALYRVGRVVQYAYVERPLALWDVQNGYASRPWSFEPPSAGLALSFEAFRALRARGIGVAWVTHAAGLSSTGAPSLDRRLPLPERYEVPEETVRAVAATRAAGGRVVAVGTTVVRALESAATSGELRAGEGTATLTLDRRFRRQVVDDLLSGMHVEGSSHFALLEAFVDRETLERGLDLAVARGYAEHEFGDLCLVHGDPVKRRVDERGQGAGVVSLGSTGSPGGATVVSCATSRRQRQGAIRAFPDLARSTVGHRDTAA